MKYLRNTEWIVIASFFFLLNVATFVGEWKILGMNFEIAVFMRLSTFIVDVFFIGFYTFLRVKLRRILKRYLKQYITIIYLSDTFALLFVFYFLYVCRLWIFLEINKINQEILLRGIVVGFGASVIFGWILSHTMRNISRKIKKKTRTRGGLRFLN